MLVNGSVFVGAEDREIRADLECNIRDRVARRARFNEPNHCWILAGLLSSPDAEKRKLNLIYDYDGKNLVSRRFFSGLG